MSKDLVYVGTEILSREDAAERMLHLGTPSEQIVEALSSLVSFGGPGSGNFGHAGIPGQQGGSAPAGAAGGDDAGTKAIKSDIYARTKEIGRLKAIGTPSALKQADDHAKVVAKMQKTLETPAKPLKLAPETPASVAKHPSVLQKIAEGTGNAIEELGWQLAPLGGTALYVARTLGLMTNNL